MGDTLYDTNAYARFAEKLKPLLDSPNIRHTGMRELRKLAFKTGFKTSFGSHGWRSAVSSRVGPKTVYLGGDKVVLPKTSDLHKEIIKNAPEELEIAPGLATRNGKTRVFLGNLGLRSVPVLLVEKGSRKTILTSSEKILQFLSEEIFHN